MARKLSELIPVEQRQELAKLTKTQLMEIAWAFAGELAHDNATPNVRLTVILRQRHKLDNLPSPITPD